MSYGYIALGEKNVIGYNRAFKGAALYSENSEIAITAPLNTITSNTARYFGGGFYIEKSPLIFSLLSQWKRWSHNYM